MAFAPLPSSEDIIRMYDAGDLAAEVAKYHDRPDDKTEPFFDLCVQLHNDGKIDLVSLPGRPEFAAVAGHEFFTAQHFYCETIPKLKTDAHALMDCCRILIEKAGADGAAGLPNNAFREWCKNNVNECSRVVRDAKSGNKLARQFVTFALQAADNLDEAISFIHSFSDDRRLVAMAALAGMTLTNAERAKIAIETLEPYLSSMEDDNVRANALVAVFDVLKQQPNEVAANRLAIAATKEPGPATLHSLARIVWLHHKHMTTEALEAALGALEHVQAERLGTVRVLDMALSQVLRTASEALALNFLSAVLCDGKFTLEAFKMTSGKLKQSDPQRRYELIVRWLLSGCINLCSNVEHLSGLEDKRPFDTNVTSLGLSAKQQTFLCRKAIGFFFLRPIICCSIIVSVLRGVDSDVEDEVSDLLFDPLLLSYSGIAIDYLKGLAQDDPAHAAVQRALGKQAAYFAGLEKAGVVKELHPSDYKRDVVRQRNQDEMRGAQKAAEQQSILFSLVRPSTLLYGKRSLTYVQDDDGGSRPIAMDLHSFGVSIEWPRRDIVDPVGLDYMIRVYRVEKLQ